MPQAKRQQTLGLGDETFGKYNRARRHYESLLVKHTGEPAAVVNAFVKAELIAVQTGNKDGSSKDLDDEGWRAVLNEMDRRVGMAERGEPGALSPIANGESRMANVGRPESAKSVKSADGSGSFDPGRNPSALATAAQRGAIQKLAARVGMTTEDLQTMCEKRWRWRIAGRRWQASNLIEALKSIVYQDLQLGERVAKLDRDGLFGADRDLLDDFLATAKPNALKIGAILWAADLCDRFEIPLAPREDAQ
jgi:hypothetical protein